MNDEELNLLLEEVRKRGLSISEKDPVLSVLVGYDLLFRTHIKNTDLLLQQHKVDMTSIGEENYQKIRLLAIEKISTGLDQALDKMDTYTLKKISEINDVAHDAKPKQEIPIFYWVFTLMAAALGYMLCLSIIG